MSKTKLFRLEIPDYTPMFDADISLDIREAFIRGVIWRICRGSGIRVAKHQEIVQRCLGWRVGHLPFLSEKEVNLYLDYLIDIKFIEEDQDSSESCKIYREVGEVL